MVNVSSSQENVIYTHMEINKDGCLYETGLSGWMIRWFKYAIDIY